MPRQNPHRPFVPHPGQQAVTPEVSGNTVNGVGETTPRLPRKVYWSTDTTDIAHGPMQEWFFTVDPGHPTFAEERSKRRAVLSAPLPPVAATRLIRTPDDWTAALTDFVERGEAEAIGVTAIDPSWMFEGYEPSFDNVIVIAVQHDYEAIATAPEPEAGAEVMRQYTRVAAAAKSVAGWLHDLGWAAEPVTGPMTGSLALIPPALACGLGELGKHGSAINPEFGASFRLSAVMTDAPFAPTPRQEWGIDDFCAACRICEDACPPEAISPDKQTVRGTEKWYVDFDRCLPFFNEHQGCSICIAVCPWSRPGVGLNLAGKLARRADRPA